MSSRRALVISTAALLAAGLSACASPRIESPMMVQPLQPGRFLQDGDALAPRPASEPAGVEMSARGSKWEPWEDTVSVELDMAPSWAVGLGLGLRDDELLDDGNGEAEALVHGVAIWVSFSF
jgi:hypothetical protein